jgi:uncharacterized membrane protein
VIKNIDQYLDLLKEELAGSDRATIQDALADAEEHLRTAFVHVRETQADVSETEALPSIIQEYGSPQETAMAYREIEARIRPPLAQIEHADDRPLITRFFAVLADPGAWGALLYMLFSLLTGIVYFTWAVTGLSLSLSLMVLIVGIPFTVLFLLSVRGIALVEGLLVQALLGVRMPRRPAFSGENLGWWERLKSLAIGKRTWLTIVYMLLQLPLGILYFTVFITLIALCLSFIATPVLELGFDIPLITMGNTIYHLPDWLAILTGLAGVLLMPVTMHLAKFTGRIHGSLAKGMLVSD